MKEQDIPMILVQTIRMKALVPVIRSFENAFGKDRVHSVLRRHAQQDLDDARGTPGRDADFERAAKMMGKFAAGDALDYKVIAKDRDQLDVDVTRCAYANLMRELDAVDLGHLFLCQADFAPALRAGMELTRTQTRMQGASHCDFRFTRREGT